MRGAPMAEPKKPIVFPEVDTSGKPKSLMAGSWPTLYVDSWASTRRNWTEIVVAYEENPEDLYRAWMWLTYHPIFWYYGRRRHISTLAETRGVHEGLELQPAMVNKVTRKAKGPWEDREVEIWVEVFPASMTRGNGDIRLHDIELDTGAPTYEATLLKVAKMIYDRHGNDRVKLTELWEGA